MMKNTTTMLSALLAAGLWTANAAWAHGKEGHAEGGHAESAEHHEHGQAGGSGAALAILAAHLDSVNTDLAADRLDRIHDHSEAMNAAVKGLDEDPSLDAAKRKRVAGYIKNIAKLTDSMHDAAHAEKAQDARKWAKKLTAQVELLDKQFAAKAHKAADHGPDSAATTHP